MNDFIIKKLTENKWFGLYDKINELTTKEFIDNICENCKLSILIQYAENNQIGLYAVIKGVGLYGFTTQKSNFFKNKDVDLHNTSNGIQTFILNEKQTLKTFISIFSEFLREHNKKLKNKIELVYYQNEIDKIIENNV